MRVLKQVAAKWQSRGKLGEQHRQKELAAFFPPALEIQETPPNPLARWLAYGLLLLVIAAVIWALLGEVNIVASAEGKIIPSARVKQIQPLEKGVVKKILVKEGQLVEQGDALIELDATISLADKSRLESDLNSTELQLKVSKQLLAKLTQTADDETTDDFEIFDRHPLHRELLRQHWLTYSSEHQALKSSLDKTLAEQAANQEVINKLSLTLPIVTERSQKLKTLHQQSFVSENDYLDVEQQRIQQFHDLAAEKQRAKQLKAIAQELIENMRLHESQTKSRLLTEIAELQRQLISLNEELTKASDINQKRILYAPVAGQVQDVTVTTEGGVVTEAQQLMQIVPRDEQLEVEVFLENKDIGFVREAMDAEIKVHTFPFTKYGVINAVVSNVSDDAVLDEVRGLLFKMQLTLKRDTIKVNGLDIRLLPGMAVTAEIKTGERRIIEFFLAPLLRHKAESIRER